jgi:hypothetical protein
VDGVLDLVGGEGTAAHRRAVPVENVADRSLFDAEPSTRLVHGRPDGSCVAAIFDDNTLRIRDVVMEVTLAELRLDSDLSACAWLGSDRLVVLGGYAVYRFTWVAG